MISRWNNLVAVGALLVCGLAAAAQQVLPETGYWRATSEAARSTTGDIALTPERIIINFLSFPMTRARGLEPGELSSVFDVDNRTASSAASLYRLGISGSQKFLRKNTLCGSDNVIWMVAYPSGRSLQLAFFSGEKPPQFNFDAMANSSDRCGTYGYSR